MIHEFASAELGGIKGIRRVTGISKREQQRLTKAANNLSPLHGGRHASDGEGDLMTLDQQRALISALLGHWIGTY